MKKSLGKLLRIPFIVSLLIFLMTVYTAWYTPIDLSKIQNQGANVLSDTNRTEKLMNQIQGNGYNNGEHTMVFVGDIMLSRGIGKIIEQQKVSNFLFREVEEFLQSADLTFGNLESPVSGRGKNQGSIYSFNANPYAISGLVSAGFDVVSLANNHILDYGPQALIDTLSILKISGIDSVGAGIDYQKAHTPIIRKMGDTRVAFLSYTNLIPTFYTTKLSVPAIAYLDLEAVKHDISIAKVLAHIVVVSFHWGEEYETKHNQWQEKIAKEVIDSGASLVIGHHPHVIQEVEKYKDGYIAYSLGNFIFDQNFSEDTGKGLILKAIVKNKRIINIETKEVHFNSSFQLYFPSD